jgi:hypothetical protein
MMTVKKTFSVTCFATEAIQEGIERITDEHRILEAFFGKESHVRLRYQKLHFN